MSFSTWVSPLCVPETADEIADDDSPAEIEKESLIQAEAARRLNVTRPRVSDLTRGNMLTDAGVEVDLRIKAGSRSTKRVA